ncbi:uncharacterized protein F5891DRAFT_1195652 [Suillus fuscotomentosus]|uniref:Uncharacterized protein n=1 Tax=Suillus fuscotomentosus TaxID=1912939 RepID=A0AAD4DUI1_9AGAM|nr:uncharacterized protein F5891DRAFT_1195652 [Suillus fuscotomentosus]KAG1894092.1 hypothetical protein F5891DRAFT_1195652 [Suillus fuscotomentosus]
MPPRASLTPSEIAAHKRNSKTKAKASQESGGENQGDTDKPLQRSSKIKALEQKVWNETMANSRKRAPTIYAILKDWSSSNPPSNAQVKSFNASSHVGVYKAHQATLNRIFNGSIKKYHTLMARLYKAVSAIENSASTASSSTCDYQRPLPHQALATISISMQWSKNKSSYEYGTESVASQFADIFFSFHIF